MNGSSGTGSSCRVKSRVDASVVRREFRERTAVVEINGIYESNVFKGYRNEAFNDIFKITNNVWNWPVYTFLELQATKQTERVQVHRQLYASVAPSGRHVAAERSGGVHSAGCVPQQQGDRLHHEHVRVAEQPVEQPDRAAGAGRSTTRSGSARSIAARGTSCLPPITRFSQASGPARSSPAWRRQIPGSDLRR